MTGPRSRNRGFGSHRQLLIALLAILAGCGSPGGAGRGSREAVGDIHLFGVPVALNLDGNPGPDGLGVRVYASAPGVARGVAIRQGTLEILMFDGAVDVAQLRTTTPVKIWRFDATNLRPFAAETSLGLGYQLALKWEKSPPRGPAATVVARYRSPAGVELYSTANGISIPAR